MANQWLRLWHDMPTDPKWRTISRASGQSIGNVMAVYCHILVCASNADERGRTQSFNCEDVASALDVQTADVAAIVDAMQGRVLDGDRVAGWEKRQVAREDGAAERAKAWREAQKQAKQAQPNDSERNRTQAERKQTPDKDTDKDTDKEEIKNKKKTEDKAQAPVFVLPDWINREHWDIWHGTAKRKRATVEQKQLAVDKLHGWMLSGLDYAGALENAALGGNQGLFLPSTPAKAQSGETAYQRSMREKYEVATGRSRPQTGGIVDVAPLALG